MPKFETEKDRREARDRNVNIARLHPGPATFVIPDRHPETDVERLARIEREFLDMAVKHHVEARCGPLGDKAIAVLVQRAIVNG